MKKLFALFFLIPSLAIAQITVFGLEFGKPLPLPKCPISQTLGSVNIFSQSFVCVDEGSWGTSIVFPYDKMPSIGKSPSIRATIKNGVLAGLTIYTFGASTQDSVFDSLQDKFGKPTTTSKEMNQNAYGAQFSGINALWKNSDINVEFWGVFRKVDTGVVWIETPEVRAERIAEIMKPKGTSLDAEIIKPNAATPANPTQKLRLGIQYIDKTVADKLPEVVRLNLPKNGLLISVVQPNSPAALAGICIGDVLIEFAGSTVNVPTDMAAVMVKIAQGALVDAIVIRSGQTLRLSVQM